MARINEIEFVRHRVAPHRRHYVDEDDVKVVLSRLPEELWGRLKRVLFKDDARGRRVYGYTTTRGRRDISLCALPHRVSLSQVCTQHGHSPEAYGALRGSQWPTLAVRRYLLYNTLLHEVGHLQIILPKAANPNRKYAGEGKAQEFADRWRRKLWPQPFDHPDPVHNPPSKDELRLLKEGWAEAHRCYKKGYDLEAQRRRKLAVPQYQRALELYPNHTHALERLGILSCIGLIEEREEDRKTAAAALLRRAIALDRGLFDAHLFLAIVLGQLKQQDEAHRIFQRAIELDPYGRLAMTVLADNLSDWELNEQAEEVFKKVLKRSPKDTLALKWFARHLLSRSEERVNEDIRQAIDLLQQAVNLNPDDADSHYLLGLAYSFLDNRKPDALRQLRHCLRLKPDHKKAAKRLAELAQNRPADGGGDPHGLEWMAKS